jgi:hypothetical protein
MHRSTGGVFPVNVPVVTAFLFVASQWRVASRGRRPFYVGLDYAAARAALDARRIAVTPELWDGLTVMEMAARDALNGEAG